MSEQTKICTLCLNKGIEKEKCYGHLPGKDCPTIQNYTCQLCNEKGHTQKYCKKLVCKFCKKEGHKVDDCQKLEDKKRAENTIFCKFCKSDDHKVDQCQKLKDKKRAENTIFCKFCKANDHVVDDCQKLKDKQARICSFCGEHGHTSRFCNSPYNSMNRY